MLKKNSALGLLKPTFAVAVESISDTDRDSVFTWYTLQNIPFLSIKERGDSRRKYARMRKPFGVWVHWLCFSLVFP